MTEALKLGIQFGYWTAAPRSAREHVEAATFAESLGYDSVWTGESWSSDAFSPLAAVAAATSRIRMCTGIAQMSARSPSTMAMHAMTLDGLSGGRFALGIGVSGPQVVEGWYGRPFGKPLARTREYVDIIRRILAREEPVEATGEHYPMPYRGDGSVGLGKPLKMITHPLRADIPIYLGAEGPKNVGPGCRAVRRLGPALLLPLPTGGLPRLPHELRRTASRSRSTSPSTSTTTSPARSGRSRRRSASTSVAWAPAPATSIPS